MSPSFRDLKGRPVEDVVDSRMQPNLPDPGEQMVERDAVKKAVEKITAGRTRGSFTPDDDTLSRQPGVVALPEDMEQALAELQSTATNLHIAVTDGVRQLTEQVAAIRARAEKDAGKLAKLAAMLKALEE